MKELKIKVLYIDDEVNNLNAFKMSFRRQYEIYTATNTLDAREILKNTSIHIIIADQKMPGTSGIDFFKIIKNKYPDSIRILLTAYGDLEVLSEAINKGQIYQYLKKPWDEHILENVVQKGYDLYRTKEELESKIQELERTNDELSRFIYSASHDLRTPLLSALGIIKLSRSDRSIQDPNNYMGMIETNIARVENNIEGIITYYKNARFQPSYEQIRFKSLIQDCIESCQILNPELNFQVDAMQPVTFYGDMFRISAVFKNLIYCLIHCRDLNPKDKTIRIFAAVDEHNAVIRVDGEGMDKFASQFEVVFDSFLGRKEAPNMKAGIRTYIIKEALNRMEGKIVISGEYNDVPGLIITIPNRTEK